MSIPSAFKDVYQFNEVDIELAHLPRSAGIPCGGYVNGEMMDRYYRTTAKRDRAHN